MGEEEAVWASSQEDNILSATLTLLGISDEGGREDVVAERLLMLPCVNGDDIRDRVVAVSQSLRPRTEGEGVDMEVTISGPLTSKAEAETPSVPRSLPH